MVQMYRALARALIAATILVFSALSINAEVVSPADVKIADGSVKASLTGNAGDATKGRLLFFDRKLGNCLACHANKDLSDQPFHGEIGPALDGVASRYSPDQLRAIVINSKDVFGGETIMPAFYRVINDQRTRKEFQGKTILTAEQVEDVIAYLLTLKE